MGGGNVLLDSTGITIRSASIFLKDGGGNVMGSIYDAYGATGGFTLVGMNGFGITMTENTSNNHIYIDRNQLDLYDLNGPITLNASTVINLTAGGASAIHMYAGHIEANDTAYILLPQDNSDPGSPVEGTMLYRTDTHVLRLYNGTDWCTIDMIPDP